LLGSVARRADTPKNPGGDTRFEIDAVADREVTRKVRTAADGAEIAGAAVRQLQQEHALQPAGTSGEERLAHRERAIRSNALTGIFVSRKL
jgi:hypothetical protein